MSESSECDKNGLTFFDRLSDEPAEQNETNSPAPGVLSSFFGRIWKSERVPSNGSISSNGTTIGGNGENEISVDTGTGHMVNGNGLSTNGGTSQEPHQNSRMSPSTTSITSQDSTDSNSTKLNKLTAILRGRRKQSQELRDYNRSNFKDYWMPDSTGRECYQCEEKFTAFRRKHHCRLCGQIFCAKCCNIHVPGAALGYTGDLRLCNYCANMMAQYLPAEADRNVSQESEQSSSGQFPPIPMVTTLNNNNTVDVTIGPEIGDSQGISTVSGGSLMWSGRPEMTSRGQSPVGERKNSMSMPPTTYRPPTMLCVQELYSQHEEKMEQAHRQRTVSNTICEDEESGPDWFRNMSIGQESLNGMGREEKSDPSTTPSVSRDDFDPKPILDMPAFDLTDSIKIDTGEDTSKEPLSQKSSITCPVSPTKKDTIGLDADIDKAFDRRTERMLDYLFTRERINDERWKSIVLSLSRRLASTVRVDVEKRKDSMNILSYIHVKKLVVAEEKPVAETVWGVVCSKTLLDSSMQSHLHNASVMIVAGSIEYERISGKLSTIEPIICQETEFLSKQVDRILSRRPSLLLVEGGVSRVAAQLLRKAGVSVVINVRPSVLGRVARSTGADVLPSSDAQLIQQNIGFCPAFQQRTEKRRDGSSKMLLVWSDCPPERGCSVLLRGRCGRELRAVKRVLQLMTSLIYSAQLEKAYLNMFKSPVSAPSLLLL